MRGWRRSIIYNTRLYPDVLLDELKNHHTSKMRRIFTHLPKFIFLCGKDRNATLGNNRALVENFFLKNRTDVFCIYAEDLFVDKGIDLLTFELFLTEMSDYIILFVESEGSACELGAFAMNQNIYEKMIVFRDLSKKDVNSFINDGPLKKISGRAHIIYADLSSNNAVFIDQCHNTLKDLPIYKTCKININENHVNIRTFMLELLELIRILGPITQNDLIEIYKFIKGFKGFKFMSETENNTSSRVNINITYILDMINKSGAVVCNNGLIKLNTNVVINNIMLDLSINQLNSLRAKFISKKYKYGEGLEA